MKDQIRNDMLVLRENHGEQERSGKNREIIKHVLALPEFGQALVVMVYVSIKGEVETRDLIKICLSLGKKVVVPITDQKDNSLSAAEIKDLNELTPGAFGIPEPKSDFIRLLNPEDINLVIVPGIAFDRRGNRIGYGFGYYDNFLKKLKSGCSKIALAYDFQIVGEIPAESNDVRVERIVTESGSFLC